MISLSAPRGIRPTGPGKPETLRITSPFSNPSFWKRSSSILWLSCWVRPTTILCFSVNRKCLPVLSSSKSRTRYSCWCRKRSFSRRENVASVRRHPPAGAGYSLIPYSFARAICGFLERPERKSRSSRLTHPLSSGMVTGSRLALSGLST